MAQSTAQTTHSDSGVETTPDADEPVEPFKPVEYARGDDKRTANSQSAAYALEFDGFLAAETKSKK